MDPARPRVPIPPLRDRPRDPVADVVVVGSGIGGCVAAALLARAGRRVVVIEKNDAVGGILASTTREGFKLDRGSHLVARGERGPLGVVLRRLGLLRPAFLTHRIPVRSRGLFAATAPPRRSGLPGVAVQVARDLGLPPAERRHLARLFFEVFTLTEAELRRWDGRPLEAFVRSHTRHPAVHYLLGFLASIFFVLPPWEVSAGEAIRSLRGLLWAYHLSYVEGGMDSLPHALLGVVTEAGGEVVVGQRVRAIRPEGGRLSVFLSDGCVAAPVVVANTAPRALLGLLEPDGLPGDWVQRVTHLRASGAAHQLKVALSRPLVDEGCFIAGVHPGGATLGDLDLAGMRASVAAIEAGHATSPFALYAPVPSNFDPSVAPPGCQLLAVSLYGPTRPDPADPPEVWEEAGLDALRSLLPGLDEALLFTAFTPVPAVGGWMGRADNAAISNAQVPGQVGAARLPVATPVPGLWLCGDGAGGRGIGTELAASSGIEVAAAVLRAG